MNAKKDETDKKPDDKQPIDEILFFEGQGFFSRSDTKREEKEQYKMLDDYYG